MRISLALGLQQVGEEEDMVEEAVEVEKEGMKYGDFARSSR